MQINTDNIAQQCLNAINDKINNLKRLNIIVIGKSGVGKSTLINSLFRGNFADTGLGSPVAQEIRNIDKSLGRLKGQSIEKGTKNQFSVRKIKLDPETVSILQKWKENTLKEKARLTVAPLNIDQEYIFTYCNQAGEIEALHPDYLNNILSRIIRNHGLRKISPHGFRHTHTTLMIELGIDPVNTAKRLGHASSQMTLDTYSHSTAAGEDRTISQFADYLSKNI